MAVFIPARTLKRSYIVRGYFYDVSLARQGISCRSILEISRNDCQDDEPDAIFIMMNPGSSMPIGGAPVKLTRGQVGTATKVLVPTKPDKTQYQIMRVMHFCSWRYVRVINLSDLRDPDSKSFMVHYKDVESKYHYPEHSIFHTARDTELVTTLQRKHDGPIICAWGVSANLNPLITQCMTTLRRNHAVVVGLVQPNAQDKYFHPLPRSQEDKLAWVSHMVTHLTGFSEPV